MPTPQATTATATAAPPLANRALASEEAPASTSSTSYMPQAATDSTFTAAAGGYDRRSSDDSEAPSPALILQPPPGSDEDRPATCHMLPPAFGDMGDEDACDSSIASLPDAGSDGGSPLGGLMSSLPGAFAMMPDGNDDISDGPAMNFAAVGNVDPAGSAPASLCTTPTAGATTTTFGPSVGGASAMAMSASVLGAGLVPVLDDGSLLLGPYRDANDAALCADLGVGAYLCVARECEVPPHAVASGAPTLHLPLVDGPSEQLAEHVPRACAWIDAQAGLGRRVAVFCRAGKSRSVSIAAAYVMHRTGMSGRAALAHVKTVHPRADPNLSFVMQIGEIGAVTPLAASSSLCR